MSPSIIIHRSKGNDLFLKAVNEPLGFARGPDPQWTYKNLGSARFAHRNDHVLKLEAIQLNSRLLRKFRISQFFI